LFLDLLNLNYDIIISNILKVIELGGLKWLEALRNESDISTVSESLLKLQYDIGEN
jgi:hypothetical protein